jgi:hypothetical protein
MAKRVPLAPGDYVLPGHVYVSLQMAFLQLVSKLVPDALTSLQALAPGDEAGLRVWAERWHLTDRWILDTARRHLVIWQESPEYAGRWLTVTTARWEPVPDAIIPEPWRETKAAFVARAEAAYEAAAAAAGATKTPHKQPTSARHLVWLVRHHVAGETLASIAAREPDGPSLEAISQAITEMAALINYTRV